MKLKSFALLAFAATVGLVACEDDLTSGGAGEPFAIVTSRSETNIALGNQASITAYVIDQNNRRIPGALTATPAGNAVSLDSVIYVPELAETRIFARGAATSAAGTDITISGHNLSTTVKVIVQ